MGDDKRSVSDYDASQILKLTAAVDKYILSDTDIFVALAVKTAETAYRYHQCAVRSAQKGAYVFHAVRDSPDSGQT